MPELPDVSLYVEHLERRLVGARLDRVRLRSPFFLRSVDPPLDATHGRVVVGVSRLGKRIVLSLDGDLFLIVHLMIAGRLAWKEPQAAIKSRNCLAAFDFEAGTLVVTEAGSKKRASLYAVRGVEGLRAHDRGGLEPLGSSLAQFRERLCSENRTLKRALTAPQLFSGIGNAYSDEILHAAGLSPVKLTSKLGDEEIARLHRATVDTLEHWVDALRSELGDEFPKKVTAFRPEMAVHGKFGQPCPRCQTRVQRIVYANNEVNYCPRCQTGGKMLADRALSRLLKGDWPSTIDAWEEEHPVPTPPKPPPSPGARPRRDAVPRPARGPGRPGAARRRPRPT